MMAAEIKMIAKVCGNCLPGSSMCNGKLDLYDKIHIGCPQEFRNPCKVEFQKQR